MKKRIVEKIIRNYEQASSAEYLGLKVPKIPFHTPEQVDHLKYNNKFAFRKRRHYIQGVSMTIVLFILAISLIFVIKYILDVFMLEGLFK